jgi:hypothetical protein
MYSLKCLTLCAAAAIGIAALSVPSMAEMYYTINGQPAPYEWQVYMASNGLQPGNYWLTEDGYWGVMGNSKPGGNIFSGTYFSGSGSGEQGSNGWSHTNSAADYWVGGDANGCVYTTEWSNC